MKQVWKIAQYVIFLGIGLYLFRRAVPAEAVEETWAKMKEANVWWIVAAIALTILAHLSRAARWNMLIKPLGYEPKLLNSFYALMFGYAANTLVPRMGEVSRCILLNRSEKVPISKLFGTVVVERIFDLLALFSCLMLALVVEFDLISGVLNELFADRSEGLKGLLNIYTVLIVVAVIVVGFFALKWLLKSKLGEKIKGFLKDFKDGLVSIRNMKGGWIFVLHTIFIWTAYFMMAYIIIKSVGGTSHLSWEAGLIAFVFGSIGFIAPTPGGIGTYQVMFMLALSLYSIDVDVQRATANISYWINILINVIVGVLAFFIVAATHKKVIPTNEPAEGKS